DLLVVMQDVGAHALPIVSLIAFLVGTILAYVGAVQLRAFGAQIYVADLVRVATTSEMGATMTAVVMAGRTGTVSAALPGAVAGWVRVMGSGPTSAAVGGAATSAVVTAIVLIIVADAVMTVLFDLLNL